MSRRAALTPDGSITRCPLLLDRQNEDDVEVLVLRGNVAVADAPSLGAAVASALQGTNRGVLVDLTAADVVDREAVDALASAAAGAGRWPPLSVCGPEVLQPRLAPLPVHRDRQVALAEVVMSAGVGRRREVQVDHGPQGPGQARAAVQAWAGDIGLGSISDDVLLIVSELVTNAVRYGEPPVCVSVRADEDTVTVGVADSASERPTSRVPEDDAESGRGLLLMSLLSADFGIRPREVGKVVWARLPRV